MIANLAQFAVSKVASDDLDLVHASKRGSPELYLADTGLLCALLNIRSEEALRQSRAVGAVRETFAFAQLRDRERRGGRTGSLFFRRDRTHEVDGTARCRRYGESRFCRQCGRQIASGWWCYRPPEHQT